MNDNQPWYNTEHGTRFFRWMVDRIINRPDRRDHLKAALKQIEADPDRFNLIDRLKLIAFAMGLDPKQIQGDV